MSTDRTPDQCACCGANRDGSFEIGIEIRPLTGVPLCNCAGRAPTPPVFRAVGEHLSDCPHLAWVNNIALELAARWGMTASIREVA